MIFVGKLLFLDDGTRRIEYDSALDEYDEENWIFVEFPGIRYTNYIRFTKWKNRPAWNTWTDLMLYRLNKKLTEEQKKKMISIANDTAEKGIVYNLAIPKLIDNLSKPRAPNKTDGKRFYCVEFVAELYKQTGLLPMDISSSSFNIPLFDGIGINEFKKHAKTENKLFYKKTDSILLDPWKFQLFKKINIFKVSK